MLIHIFLYREHKVVPLSSLYWRNPGVFHSSLWFLWKSLTQLEKEIWIFSVISPFFIDRQWFFLQTILSDALPLSVSLCFAFLVLIALEQIDCLKSVMANWEAEDALSEGKGVCLGPWEMTCRWVSIGYWSLSFVNKIGALFCFLDCFSIKLTRICLSFFGLQLWKKDLLISGGNKEKPAASPKVMK